MTLDGGLPAVFPETRAAYGAGRGLGDLIRSSVLRKDFTSRREDALEDILRKQRPRVVLSQYGQTGGWVAPVCERLGIPTVVHFHGHDATERELVAKHREAYERFFASSAAIVAVSRKMVAALTDLNCPNDKIVLNPYGVSLKRFTGANPGAAMPRFLAVGRMVEKKAPHLTVLAFSRVLAEVADARLIMIGDGPLMGACRDLAVGLGVEDAIDFLGAQPPSRVAEEMKLARAFVQHSVEASNGDCEGTPVAVLESSAAGLPVIASRHAGIPDVVVDGETGLLFDERDVDCMTAGMLQAAHDAPLCQRLGEAGQRRVSSYFTIGQSVGRLQRVLDAAARGESIPAIRDTIVGELPENYQTHESLAPAPR